MKIYHVIIVALVFSLTACAGPNGTASGTHRGESAHTDIFKFKLPPVR